MSHTRKFKNREVEIELTIEVGEGVWIDEAHYCDGEKEELTEEEIEDLSALYCDDLYQDAYENLASVAYDRAKDLRKYGE